MNILMITENDPAGMGIAFTNAINRYTDHTCRLITKTLKYNFYFEKDIHLPNIAEDGYGEISELLKKADILHFHMLSDEHMALGPFKVKDFINGKSIIHHHHGHPHFRSNPEKYRNKYRQLKRKILVSTPDLLHLLPEATWQPNLVPIHDDLFLPQHAPLNGSVMIGQSATRKDIKNTDDLEKVVSKLQRQYRKPELRLDIIEKTDYRECLKRKKECHIIFDQMQGYYGVSSLESLSQGKPVIAGLDDWNAFHIKEFTGCEELPWVLARNPAELEARLKALFSEAELRDRMGERSRSFMEKHWSEQHALAVLLRTYESL